MLHKIKSNFPDHFQEVKLTKKNEKTSHQSLWQFIRDVGKVWNIWEQVWQFIRAKINQGKVWYENRPESLIHYIFFFYLFLTYYFMLLYWLDWKIPSLPTCWGGGGLDPPSPLPSLYLDGLVCVRKIVFAYIRTLGIQEKSRNVTKPTVSVYLCSQMSAAFKAVIQSIDLFQTVMGLQNKISFSILWFYNDVPWFRNHP